MLAWVGLVSWLGTSRGREVLPLTVLLPPCYKQQVASAACSHSDDTIVFEASSCFRNESMYMAWSYHALLGRLALGVGQAALGRAVLCVAAPSTALGVRVWRGRARRKPRLQHLVCPHHLRLLLRGQKGRATRLTFDRYRADLPIKSMWHDDSPCSYGAWKAVTYHPGDDGLWDDGP